jgi:hypothetical protein
MRLSIRRYGDFVLCTSYILFTAAFQAAPLVERIGDMIGLQAHAAQIAQHDPALRPFAYKLGHLASRFESEQALALIARYLQPEQ